jgi:hemoglobin-like flavoprotein
MAPRRRFAVLTEEQLILVKKTLPLFEKDSYAIAIQLYAEIFKFDANLRNLFSLEFLSPKGANVSGCPFFNSQTLCEPISPQARILSQTIVHLASNIENLHENDITVDKIGCKHVSRDVRAEHYEVVKRAFGLALRTVLGGALSEEEHEAWNSAVFELSEMFIKHEQQIRELAKIKRGVRFLPSFSVDSISDRCGLSEASNSPILMAFFRY